MLQCDTLFLFASECAHAGTLLRVPRGWSVGDKLSLSFPMSLRMESIQGGVPAVCFRVEGFSVGWCGVFCTPAILPMSLHMQPILGEADPKASGSQV